MSAQRIVANASINKTMMLSNFACKVTGNDQRRRDARKYKSSKRCVNVDVLHWKQRRG